MNHPGLLAALLVGALYLAKLWRDDCRAGQSGRPNRGAFPGATTASFGACAIAATGALILVALETLGERALGIYEQQTKITVLFAAYSILGASVIEELIFRGWLVIENRGRLALWGGIVGASLAFALIHPFLWEWSDDGLHLHLTAKGVFSTVVAFATSLWFYAARFAPWNSQRSLLPCFVAHAAKNAGVVAVKTASGFVSGVW